MVRLYRPTFEPCPLVVFLHGGMWTIGDLDSHDRACRRLSASAQVAVLAVDFRQAPEHPWPAAQGRVGDPQLRAPGDIVSGQVPAGCLVGDAGLRQGQVGVREGQDLGCRQGPPSSRSRRQASVARFPPELSPAMTRVPSVPVRFVW